MSKTIIVTSSDKVNELLSHNFKFVYDSVNGKQVHAFLICDELIDYVNKHFSENDYVCPGSYFYNDEWERIDHFFVNENVNVISFEPLINELWCDENGIPNPYRVYTHKGFSDHLPINCKIDI